VIWGLQTPSVQVGAVTEVVGSLDRFSVSAGEPLRFGVPFQRAAAMGWGFVGQAGSVKGKA